MHKLNIADIRALSIAGPFARLLAEGTKETELRSWKTNYRGLVLFHVSNNLDYDYLFDLLKMHLKECPKASIIGCATLAKCVQYLTEEQWMQDIDKHCWLGQESYSEVVELYNNKPPFGHFFIEPVIFNPPIFDVPGALNYWQPKNEKQQIAFKKAICMLRAIS